MFQLSNESLEEKYLGIPYDVGTSQNGASKFVKDIIWNKVRGC
jgi:hypothetical protein